MANQARSPVGGGEDTTGLRRPSNLRAAVCSGHGRLFGRQIEGRGVHRERPRDQASGPVRDT